MNTAKYVQKQMSEKGWRVIEVSYERPHSGFKSIDGGWLCLFDVGYDDDLIREIKFDPTINGTINEAGVIMAMTAPDFRKLIDKIPNRKQP